MAGSKQEPLDCDAQLPLLSSPACKVWISSSTSSAVLRPLPDFSDRAWKRAWKKCLHFPHFITEHLHFFFTSASVLEVIPLLAQRLRPSASSGAPAEALSSFFSISCNCPFHFSLWLSRNIGSMSARSSMSRNCFCRLLFFCSSNFSCSPFLSQPTTGSPLQDHFLFSSALPPSRGPSPRFAAY